MLSMETMDHGEEFLWTQTAATGLRGGVRSLYCVSNANVKSWSATLSSVGQETWSQGNRELEKNRVQRNSSPWLVGQETENSALKHR